MAINKAPVDLPKPAAATPATKVPEKKIQEFINRGGSPTNRGEEAAVETGGTKSIKLILKDTEMSAIKVLRDKRPSRSRKIPISVHDWVIEAVQEKIEREQKKYGLTLL
jgi:3-hydroxyacyl-CoA dehydrogenase